MNIIKLLILSILLNLNLNAKYIIEYNSIELGEIESFNTLRDGYLEANITSFILKNIVGKNKAILFDDSYKENISNDYLKKEDKSNLISVLNEILFNGKSKNDSIKYTKNNNIINWIYTNKNGKESKGYILLDNNNNLVEFLHKEKNIKIIKI